ncbi:transporter substrate-binding domain-containing protein [Desulfovibrio sp. Huiquan2017]|uniref:transporter substrate-binding domain-containing protein n=1 Tax=Desulfovibrio sp. Huiquan2017 TaxID=2816861 RepID=UPI001A9285B7|nr:transporter substrate-binding domain-containing protein [Desulfovibrio sp. Huiquan2017]
MHSIRISLFLLALLLCAAGSARAQGKPVVYWPYFNLPPQFIVNGGGPQGMGIDVARALQRELPEYEHVFILASPHRIDEELRSGRARLVVTGLVRTAEREAYALYSDVPCRMIFPMMVVMRRGDGRRLAPDGSVSLTGLAVDGDLSYGYVPGVNCGAFAPFVASLTSKAASPRAYAAHDVAQLLDMLAARRVDWFVHDALSIWYAATKLGMRDRIAVVRADECPSNSFPGYFACPRTAQGAELMACINRAMVRLVASQELYSALKGWVPGEFGDAFNRTYAECVLSGKHLTSCHVGCRRATVNAR